MVILRHLGKLSQGSKQSVGYDLAATEDIIIPAGQRRTIGTGVHLELPAHMWAGVYSRSGLASRYGIIVLNAPGVIDPDYRGEIKVILANFGEESVNFHAGTRIAQLIFHERFEPILQQVTEISITPRGFNGLGSTGD